jgi:hypothetical protein
MTKKILLKLVHEKVAEGKHEVMLNRNSRKIPE